MAPRYLHLAILYALGEIITFKIYLIIMKIWNGLQVAICDVNTAEGEKLLENLQSKYGENRVIFCPCDVTDYMQFEGELNLEIVDIYENQ